MQLDLHRLVIAALGVRCRIAARDTDHPDLLVGIFRVALSPAIVPDPVDPAFQQRRDGPPPDREHHHRRLVAQNAGHFGLNRRGVGLARVTPVRLVRRAETGVEMLGGQISPFDLMAFGGGGIGKRPGGGMGQRGRAGGGR